LQNTAKQSTCVKLQLYFRKTDDSDTLNYLVEDVMALNSKCYHCSQTHKLKQLQLLLFSLLSTHRLHCTRKLKRCQS